MRISDWSSDVCSSDLKTARIARRIDAQRLAAYRDAERVLGLRHRIVARTVLRRCGQRRQHRYGRAQAQCACRPSPHISPRSNYFVVLMGTKLTPPVATRQPFMALPATQQLLYGART